MYLERYGVHVEKLFILMVNSSVYNIHGQVESCEERGGGGVI